MLMPVASSAPTPTAAFPVFARSLRLPRIRRFRFARRFGLRSFAWRPLSLRLTAILPLGVLTMSVIALLTAAPARLFALAAVVALPWGSCVGTRPLHARLRMFALVPLAFAWMSAVAWSGVATSA